MYLLHIGIELATLACLLFMTYDIFRNRSGLSDPEQIEFIWKRAHEIQHQPVKHVTFLTINLGMGSLNVLVFLLTTLVDVVNIKESKVIKFVVRSVSFIGASLIPIIFYLKFGGHDWKKLSRDAFLFHFQNEIFSSLVSGEYKRLQLSSDLDSFLILSVRGFFTAAFMTVPFYYIGSRLVKPETCSRIETSARPAGSASYNRSFLTALVPQTLTFLISFFAFSQLESARYDYWSDVISGLDITLKLVSASLTSILVVNHELHSGCFQWQWLAFLAPGIIGGACHVLISLVETGTVLPKFCINGAITYGTAGVLANYIYLSLADQHTKARLTLA